MRYAGGFVTVEIAAHPERHAASCPAPEKTVEQRPYDPELHLSPTDKVSTASPEVSPPYEQTLR